MPLIGASIATTTDNFRKMVEEGCLLVDKSLMIKEFIENPDDAMLITRPRRFGKSLNLSMLHHFFASTIGGLSTQGLFDQFEIAKVDGGEFLRKHQGQYPVIFVTFKDLKEDSFDSALKRVRDLIKKLFREHQYLLVSDRLSEYYKREYCLYLESSAHETKLETALEFLSECLYLAYDHKQVIILIDEYDTPLTSAYEHHYLDPPDPHKNFPIDSPKGSLGGFMRNLLSAALKGNSFLKKGLITGILRVSKENMLSGLSNLKTHTHFSKAYKQYFGFTEAEVLELLQRFNAMQSLEAIRQFYNGYLMGDIVIYNPWSVMNCLSEGRLAPYWVLTSNDNLLKNVLLNSSDQTKRQLNELIRSNPIEGDIATNLLYEDLMERPYALWTLLLFCGYLKAELKETVGTRLRCQLKIPNTEIRTQYTEIFTDWLKKKIGDEKYHSFLKSLVDGHVEEFVKQLTAYLFSCTSAHDFQAESDYHTFVLGLLCGITESHFIYSNKEYGAGRPDCLIIPQSRERTQAVILEFKHLHFEPKIRQNIDILKQSGHKSAAEALEQIDSQGYAYGLWQYTYLRSVMKIGISFSNRVVCAAYTVSEIKAREVLKDSDVKFFDVSEEECQKLSLYQPMPMMRAFELRKAHRELINKLPEVDKTRNNFLRKHKEYIQMSETKKRKTLGEEPIEVSEPKKVTLEISSHLVTISPLASVVKSVPRKDDATSDDENDELKHKDKKAAIDDVPSLFVATASNFSAGIFSSSAASVTRTATTSSSATSSISQTSLSSLSFSSGK